MLIDVDHKSPGDSRCLVAEPSSVEARFGLRNCTPRGTDSHCDLDLGTWSRQADGSVQLGALAIAVDHILGEVPFRRRPPEHWALTTELSIEFVSPVERDATLHLWGSPVRMERSGGFARGGILDEHGRTVAVGSTRTLFVPTIAAPGHAAERRIENPTVATTLGEHLRVKYDVGGRAADGVQIYLSDPSAWQNGFGILHGGVWACLAEVAASRLISRTRPGLSTATLHTTYLRPGAVGLPVTMSARAVHLGSRLAVAHCTGRSDDGTVCTVSSVTARRIDDVAADKGDRDDETDL